MTNHAKQLKAPMQNDTRTAFEKFMTANPKIDRGYDAIAFKFWDTAWQASRDDLLERLKSEETKTAVYNRITAACDTPAMPLLFSQRMKLTRSALAAIIEETKI